MHIIKNILCTFLEGMHIYIYIYIYHTYIHITYILYIHTFGIYIHTMYNIINMWPHICPHFQIYIIYVVATYCTGMHILVNSFLNA